MCNTEKNSHENGNTNIKEEKINKKFETPKIKNGLYF